MKSVIVVFGVGTSLVTMYLSAGVLTVWRLYVRMRANATLCEPETVLKNDFCVFKQKKIVLNSRFDCFNLLSGCATDV